MRKLLPIVAFICVTLQVSANLVFAQQLHRPLVRQLSTAKPVLLIGNVTSLRSGTRHSVSVNLNLGPAVILPAKASVTGAPEGITFSKLQRPALMRSSLPPSAMLTTRATPRHEAIPGITMTFAIPQSASHFSIALANESWQPIPKAQFLPAADDSVIRYTSDYSRSQPHIIINRPRTFRSLRTVTVWIPLVDGVAASRKALTAARVSLTFTSANVTNTTAPIDRIFQDIERASVVNPTDIANFSVPLRASPTHASTPPRTADFNPYAPVAIDTTTYKWINQSATYIKLMVTHDGIYRVSTQAMQQSANFNLAANGWRPDNVRLIFEGVEVPILTEANPDGSLKSITFYGQHHHGEGSEFYNDETDSNAYFLTIAGSGAVKRYAPTTATNPTQFITDGNVTLHHERDWQYYAGDKGNDITTIHRTTKSPGNRFYWYSFHSPSLDPSNQLDTSRLLDTFYVASLPTSTAGKSAAFHFSIRGMSTDPNFPSDPTHHVVIRLNGSPIAEKFFSDFDSIAVEPTVPLSSIQPGVNQIEIISAGTRATIDFFYLDYYTVTLVEGLSPSTDTGITNGQWDFSATAQPGATQFQATPQPAFYLNLTDTTIVSPNGLATLARANPHLVASTESALLTPDAISLVSDWSILNTQNQADYIIITHPTFRDAATRLAVARSSAGLHALVINIEDIYNAFGYGSNTAEPIRRFLNYAYYHYSGTPVALVTLLGDASWDPKRNLNNPDIDAADRSNQQSFIPTFGEPVSDFYFSLVDYGDLDTLQPKMVIARIPVSTAADADAYIDKLIEYESAQPSDWNHKFVFVAGGDEGFQHTEFVLQDQSYIDASGIGLGLPPSNIRSQIIERTDFGSGGQVDVTHVGDIQAAMRKGAAMLYFSGHGATFTTDVALGDPNLWRNKGLYPLLVTLSCRTGAFAEPNFISVNEDFLRTINGGAVMAFGTTGYGEVTYDYVLSNKLFTLMRTYPLWHDTTRATMMNMATLCTFAKLYASDSFGFGDLNLNSRLQYSVLGDAAMGYCLRPQPEFIVNPADIQPVNALGEPIQTAKLADTVLRITATVHNAGYSATRPVLVRIKDAPPTGPPLIVIDTLARLDTTAIVTAQFLLTKDEVGEHTITVTVDPNNAFPETREDDNEASTSILVSGLSVTQFYPYLGGSGLCNVSSTAATATILTPAELRAQGGTIAVELDTTSAFTKPWTTSIPLGASNYQTLTLPLNLIATPSDGVYWWRTQIVPTTGNPTDWTQASFSVDSNTTPGFEWTGADELQQSLRYGLKVNANGAVFIPSEDTLFYDILSLSSLDPNTSPYPVSYIMLNGIRQYQFDKPGIALAILSADRAQIDTVYEFTTTNQPPFGQDYVQPFDSLIEALPNGASAIVLANWQPFMPDFTHDTSVTRALKSLGSAVGFANLDYFDSYALFGTKGASPGAVPERIAKGGDGGAEIFDTIVTVGSTGVLQTPNTAVATRFHTFSWFGPDLPAGTDITFDILGTPATGGKQVVVKSIQASQSRRASIADIDASQFSRLAIRATLERGASTTTSPELTGVQLQYDPAPEFTFTTDSIQLASPALNEGVPQIATYTIQSLTCTAASNVPVLLLHAHGGLTDTIRHIIPTLYGNANVTFHDTLQTLGQQGISKLTASVNQPKAMPEQLEFNNTITQSYQVTRDSTKPVSDILIDDRHVPPYGYASNVPWITINLSSPSPVRQSDSLAITAEMFREDSTADFSTISAANPGKFRVNFRSFGTGSTQASLQFQPLTPLLPGKYDVFAYAHDASGNVADTISQTFTVSTDNGLDDVMNYPNPFTSETDFTFVLRNNQPATVTISVYTVAGRKIRTLNPIGLHAGFNICHWDGRDEEGNLLANGTYLYRVVLRSTDATGKETTTGITEKAVIAR